MDLNTVETVLRPRERAELAAARAGARPGDGFLAGGTWLFSEPQPELRRLIDLTALGWAPLTLTPAGLEIAATCPVATLAGLEPPAEWRAGWLIAACCHAFLASFKIWNMATVGGNLCLALPAGPMISLASALDGEATLWSDDDGLRRLPVRDFVHGPQSTALRPGECLRAITLPAAALARRAAMRRASLSELGRSGVLLIGTRDPSGAFALTVTAATPRPVRLDFEALPGPDALAAALDAAIPAEGYYDDVHGRPDWRRHMTRLFAQEILAELAESRPEDRA